MSTPLDQIIYNQEGAFLPIKIMSGDDLPGINISIPFNITAYSFDGEIFDDFGNQIVAFTVTRNQLTPTGIITLSLTSAQCALIPSIAYYRMRWTVGSDIRTFLYGPFQVITPW